MNLAEWNEQLFQALVARPGSPGDPLYLYVDDEVLAQISGATSPEEALEDFTAAFRGSSFKKSLRVASAWKVGGYQGTPPLVATLAMTVLAVTLSPLGRAEHNVYSRQRDLLGLADLESGAPEGYAEYVPALWRLWNEWLDTEGARFGASTARNTRHYRNQGWARSQAIIRARDKAEIYAFFKSRPDLAGGKATGEELVSHLARWLGERGVVSRLRLVAEDSAYAEELAQVLSAALSYWRDDPARSSRASELFAAPYWSADTPWELSLAVRLEPAGTYAGRSLTDLDLSVYEVDSEDPVWFLYPDDVPVSEWFGRAIHDWKADDQLVVQWRPIESPWVAFERIDRADWLATSQIVAERTYRVLLLSADADEVVPGASDVDGPDGAGRWLEYGGSQLIPGHLLLVGNDRSPADAAQATGEQLSVRLADGLRVSHGHDYLTGGEPDAWVDGISAHDEVLIEFDGEAIDSRHLAERDGRYVLRTRTLRPDAGEHMLTIVTAERQQTCRFSTRRAKEPFGRQFEPSHDVPAAVELKPRVSHRPGAAILVFDADGNAWRGVPEPATVRWLTEVIELDKRFDLARTVDLTGLTFDGGRSVVATRRNGKSPWELVGVPGAPEDVAGALRMSLRPTDIADRDVLELLGQTDSPQGDLADSLIAAIRQLLSGTVRRTWEETPSYLYKPLRELEESVRRDVVTGPIASRLNPLDDFLCWLSERPDGAGMPFAARVWSWLHEVHGHAEAVPFRESMRLLEVLGHIRRDRRRARVMPEPTTLSFLPDSEGTAVLTGARSQRFVDELRESTESHNDDAQAALRDQQTFEVAQLRDGRPLCPSTVFVQFGNRNVLQHARALNMRVETDLPRRLFDELEPNDTVIQRVENEYVSRPSDTFDVFVPSRATPGGRWEPLTRLHQGPAFLRAHTKTGNKYLWRDRDARLYESGWARGLWKFHAIHTDRPLIGRVHRAVQMIVSDWAPLPMEFERALVARTGLLPRRARTASGGWLVYDNVPAPVVVRMRDLLGQGNKDMKRPIGVEFE